MEASTTTLTADQGQVFGPTMGLRWVANGRPFLDVFSGNIVTPGPVLEQAWLCHTTGKVEWRPVPIEHGGMVSYET